MGRGCPHPWKSAGLRHRELFLVELLVLGRGWLDQKKGQIVFDPGAGEGSLKNDGLHGLQAREVIAAVFILLEFIHRPDLGVTIEPGVEEGEERQKDATKAQQTCAHAQIVFSLSKNVAAEQLAAQSFLYQREDAKDKQRPGEIGHEVAGEHSEHRGGLRKCLAQRFISEGASDYDPNPCQDAEQLLRHASFPPAENSSYEDSDEQEIEQVDR